MLRPLAQSGQSLFPFSSLQEKKKDIVAQAMREEKIFEEISRAAEAAHPKKTAATLASNHSASASIVTQEVAQQQQQQHQQRHQPVAIKWPSYLTFTADGVAKWARAFVRLFHLS